MELQKDNDNYVDLKDLRPSKLTDEQRLLILKQLIKQATEI